jgi:hypothetical protein
MWLAVVAGVVLVLAVAWAAILWTRPEPIRIAFANSLSGPSAPAGTESLVATQLAIDEVNAKGGVNGRPIELVLFDDASNPAVARANAQTIADSPCVAVLGHFLSSTSLAAAPAYKDARIPALTGSAAADDLTSGNEYYFRALTPISTQARSIAEHLRAVMKEPKVRLVHTRDAYGESFVSGFAAAYPWCSGVCSDWTSPQGKSDRWTRRWMPPRRSRDPASSSSARQPILSLISSRRCAAAASRGRSSHPRAQPAKAICRTSSTSPRKMRIRVSSARICMPHRR